VVQRVLHEGEDVLEEGVDEKLEEKGEEKRKEENVKNKNIFYNRYTNMDDYYKILGIQKQANEKEIKKAYRKQSLIWHPDKNRSNEAKGKFQELSEAYAVLSKSEKRKIYAMFGKAGLENNGMSSRGTNPNDIFKHFFGGVNFSFNKNKKHKGPNKKIECEITIKEMMNGVTKKFSITRNIKCNNCNASGLKTGVQEEVCLECKGQGMKTITQKMGPFLTTKTFPCNICNGNGNIIQPKDRCISCKGNKYISNKEIFNAKLESGAKGGDYITIHNKGDESDKYLEPGDIIIILREKKDNLMRRIGNNLHITFPILLSEALSKFSIPFEHPNGTKILIESSYIIRPNSIHKIDNLGFTTTDCGDLIIEFDIIFPDNLDDKREELLKKLLPKRKIKTNNNLQSYHISKHKIINSKQEIDQELGDIPEW